MNEEIHTSTNLPRSLYLRLSDSRICFARYEMRQEPVFAFSPYRLRPQTSLTVNLREAVQSEPILHAPTNETLVLVSSPITPVPLAEFQEEDCDTIYNYCFPEDKPRRVFYDIVPAANTVLMFSLDVQTCKNIEEIFENVRYISALTPVLRRFSTKGIVGNTQKRLFVYRHEKSIDIAVFEETRLIMVNSYPATNEMDAAYYVFNVAKQLGMDNKTAVFYVAGENTLRDHIVDTLRQFASHVYSINPTAEFNRHIISTTEGVPYDLMSLLID